MALFDVNKIKSLILTLTLLLASVFGSTAQNVQLPSVEVYLEKWNRHHKEVNEFCLTSSCGSSNSVSPNKRFLDYEYQRFDNGAINKVRHTVNISAPAYHSMSEIFEKFITTPLPSSVGYMQIFSSSDGGVTTTESTTPINGLIIPYQMSYGRLTRTANQPNTPTPHYYNIFELIDSSITAFGVSGGDANYDFTFKLPFFVQEHTWDNLMEIVPGPGGPVQASEISFLGLPNATVVGSGIPATPHAVIVVVQGGGPFRKIDVTPAIARPFYRWGFGTPTLINVTPRTP